MNQPKSLTAIDRCARRTSTTSSEVRKNGQERATAPGRVEAATLGWHGVQTGEAWWGEGGETSPPLPWSVPPEHTQHRIRCNRSPGPRTQHREPGSRY